MELFSKRCHDISQTSVPKSRKRLCKHSEAESKEKHGVWDQMGPYAVVDYNLTLCPLQSRLQHIYHGQPYARVDLLNPMPESTLSPSQGLWIWPQGSQDTSNIWWLSITTKNGKQISAVHKKRNTGIFCISIVMGIPATYKAASNLKHKSGIYCIDQLEIHEKPSIVSHQWCDHFYRLLYSSTWHIERWKEERDIQLVHVNEANSCLARGYCVSQAAQGEQRLSSPSPPPSPPTHSPWLKICDFQGFRPKARTASI